MKIQLEFKWILFTIILFPIFHPCAFADGNKYYNAECKIVHELVVENLFMDLSKELKFQNSDILKLNKIRADRDNLIRETKMKLENEIDNLGHGLWNYYPSSKDKTQNSSDYITKQMQEIVKLKTVIIEAKVNSMMDAIKVIDAKPGINFRAVIVRLSGINDFANVEKCLANAF